MSIFDKISEAETKPGEDQISIRVDQFLCLVDIWIMSSMLMNQIHDGDQKLASDTTVRISAMLQEFMPIMDGD